MQNSCNPVFPGRQVRLASTAKTITLFGGLVSLITFFERIGLAGQIGSLMPFSYTSPNAIPPAQTLVAFMVSVVAGARRLAHTDWLRADKALHSLLGIERFPGPDTGRNLFLGFSKGHIKELKNDLQADGFCMKDFYATESAFLSVCITYNLLSLVSGGNAAPEEISLRLRWPP